MLKTRQEEPLAFRPHGSRIIDSSGPSSGHRELPAEEPRPEAQLQPNEDEKIEAKEEEPQVEVKKEPGPNLP